MNKRKYTKKKHLLTREQLLTNGYRVEFDNNGQPIIYRNESKIKIVSDTVKHKYGKDRTDLKVTLLLESKPWTVILSNVVWVYFNDQIPEGYDVDHINDDPLDNRLENLQLLTRQENLHKRGCGVNQFTCTWTEEERQKSADLRHQREKEKHVRKEHNQRVNACKTQLKQMYEQTKFEREYYQMLLEQATDNKTKKWIRKRIHNLTQRKKGIGRYLWTNSSEWE